MNQTSKFLKKFKNPWQLILNCNFKALKLARFGMLPTKLNVW